MQPNSLGTPEPESSQVSPVLLKPNVLFEKFNLQDPYWYYNSPAFQITKVKSSSKPTLGIPPSSSAVVQPPDSVLDLSRAARGSFPKGDEFKPLHIPPPMQVPTVLG